MNGFHPREEAAGEASASPLGPSPSIPERELLVWTDEEVRASLARGLADAAEGNVRRLDGLTEDDPNE